MTKKPGMLQPIGSQRVGYDLATEQQLYIKASLVAQWLKKKKNLPGNSGATRDSGSISGLGRHPGEGNGNPLQYSCLGNSMDRGAWRATVHGTVKSQTQLSD